MGKTLRVLGLATGSAAVTTAAMLALPATAQAAPAPPPTPAPCSAAADACIDLSANTTWLMHNGVSTWGGAPITSGRPGFETPTGTFHVTYKDIDHWSNAYDAPMPYSVFFTTSGIAFHEGSLTEQSHGCIHLSRVAAQVYFERLQPGDTVEVIA